MIAKHQNTKTLLILILLFCTGVQASIAKAQDDKQIIQSAAMIEAQKNQPTIITEQYISEAINHVENKINSIHNLLALQEEEIGQKIKDLDTLISFQKETIYSLETELKILTTPPKDNGMKFEVWSGILLACVAIMVTVLSISIAALNFIGFKNVKTESLEIASLTASTIAPEVAEKVAKQYFKERKFNDVIRQAVDQIAFSNIRADKDLDYVEGTPNDDI